MQTVNSISGGKTSAFMAVHYPADHDVFACVLIDDPSCAPKDEGLVRAVSDKLGMDFIATAERDATLRVVLDLEQLTGRAVTWVHGPSFDRINKTKDGRAVRVPNKSWRQCTTEMKMRPIFDWWHKAIGEKVEMRIGIRHDEMERAVKLTTSFKGVVGKRGNLNRWEVVEWREVQCPLIEDAVDHYQVALWARSTGLPFPADSNCVGCFWKPVQQLRKNWDDEPEKMEWFAGQERACGASFKDGITYDQVKAIGIQQDFMFGTGAGCDAGYCTD
jgi:hypothetical protein